MKIENSRHLKAKCGNYGILLDISSVIEIINVYKNENIIKKNFNRKNSISFTWNDQDIPYFDLHSSLGINKENYQNPQYAIVLAERHSNSPLTVIAVDEIYEIMETQMSLWHEMAGINKQLDILFDLAYPYENNNEILFRLNPTQKWLNNNNEIIHAD